MWIKTSLVEALIRGTNAGAALIKALGVELDDPEFCETEAGKRLITAYINYAKVIKDAH